MTFLSTVLADTTINIVPEGSIGDVTGTWTLGGVLSWAVSAVLIIAGLIFFFMLIIGGLRWVVSGGDKAATESARGQITAALIGLVIVFSAFAIAKLLEGVLGFSILTPNFGKIGG